MTSRIFIALLPNGAVREEIAALRDRWTWPRRATPVKTSRLHVTLHFIGEMQAEPLAALTEAMDVPFEPFVLRLSKPTVWPHGIAVLEPDAIAPPLLALHASLARVLRDLNLPVDARPFRPHITLARRANGATLPTAGCDIVWPVDGYALMSSAPSLDGAYTVLR